MAKSGIFVSVSNGRWISEELSLWSNNFDPENSTSERENSEEARTFDFDERGSVSHDKFREGEEVRENSVFRCEDVVHSEESFASVVNVAGKKREETADSGQQVDRTHQKPVDSYCLLQALTKLQTAEEVLHKGKTLNLASNCQFNETSTIAVLLAIVVSFSFFTYVFLAWIIPWCQNLVFLATVNSKV